jgi:hypothetical protein
MKIINKKLEDLKPYKNNPKKHPPEQIKKIVNSIKEYGFKIPLVVDKKNQIIAGHGRYIAGKQLKLKILPCIIAEDLTQKQIRAFRIAENRTSISGWDYDALSKELEFLNKNDFNLDLTGFDKIEYSHLIRELDEVIANNPYVEWVDMPEYTGEHIKPYRTIKMCFETDKAVKDFAKLIKQNITSQTKYLFYPKQEKKINKNKRWISETEISDIST